MGPLGILGGFLKDAGQGLGLISTPKASPQAPQAGQPPQPAQAQLQATASPQHPVTLVTKGPQLPSNNGAKLQVAQAPAKAPNWQIGTQNPLTVRPAMATPHLTPFKITPLKSTPLHVTPAPKMNLINNPKPVAVHPSANKPAKQGMAGIKIKQAQSNPIANIVGTVAHDVTHNPITNFVGKDIVKPAAHNVESLVKQTVTSATPFVKLGAAAISNNPVAGHNALKAMVPHFNNNAPQPVTKVNGKWVVNTNANPALTNAVLMPAMGIEGGLEEAPKANPELGAAGKNVGGVPEPNTLTTSTGKQLSEADFNKAIPAAKGSQGASVNPADTAFRNAPAEQNALNILANKGTREDAVQQYMKDTGVSHKAATFSVSRAARDAKTALRPNPLIPNPEGDIHNLPTAESGDYKQATINRGRVRTTLTKLNNDAQTAINKLSDSDRQSLQDYSEGTADISQADNPELVQDAVDAGRKLTDTANAFDTSAGGTTPHIANYFPEFVDRENPEIALQDELQAAQDIEEEVGPDEWRSLSPSERNDLITQRLGERTKTEMPDKMNFTYKGVRNAPRTFANRQELLKAGYSQKYPDPADAYNTYTKIAQKAIGDQAFIKATREADVANSTKEGVKFRDVRYGSGPNDTISLSKEGASKLKNDNLNSLRNNKLLKIGTAIKKSLVATSGVHGFIIPPRVWLVKLRLGADNALQSFMDHPSLDNLNNVGPDKTIEEFGSQVDSPLRGTSDMASHYKGIISGSSHNPITNLVFNHFLPAMHSSLLKSLKTYLDNRGISYDSAIARDYGHQINNVMGYADSGVGDSLTFAPSLIKSTAKMYGGALRPTGMIDRSGVLGQQLLNEFITFASKAVSNQISQAQGQPQNKSKDDFWSTFIKGSEGASLYTPFRNNKGEQIDLSFPGQYQAIPEKVLTTQQRNKNGQISLNMNSPANIVSNVIQEARNIASPLVNLGLGATTNTTYSGQPMYDPHAGLPTQAAQVGLNVLSSSLPINLQAVADQNITKYLPKSLQSAIQYNQNKGPLALVTGGSTIGLNAKADTTTGLGANDPQYFNNLTNKTNALYEGNWDSIQKGLSQQLKNTGINNQNSQQFINQFTTAWNDLNPPSMKTSAGVSIPLPYNADSSQQTFDNYTYNNPQTGDKELSPTFIMAQQLSKTTPGYPMNPIYNLNTGSGGTLLGENGQPRSVPQALVALDYNAVKDSNPSLATQIKAANGGNNGWLSKYETAKANYDTNYQKSMDTYLSSNGLSKSDINQYWQNHPNTPDPLQYPNFSQSDTNIANTYFNMLNNQDPNSTAYFKQNADVLNNYLTQTANYVRNVSIAQTGTGQQAYPTESAQVKQEFANLPPSTAQGGSSKAEAAYITANPPLEQFLANQALYTTSKTLGQNTYLNPATPNLNEGQLLNAEGSQGQTALKDIQDLGNYDIGEQENLPVGTQTNNANTGSSTTISGTTFTSPNSTYIPLIQQYAKQYGLDAKALLSVAAMEGLGGGVGDNGTSFGPFQLHVGGALPAGQTQAWAESPAGIQYAIQTIAGVAKGLTGQAAINAIVNNFERPANPQNEIDGAMTYYTGQQNYIAPPLTGNASGNAYQFMGGGGTTGAFSPGFITPAQAPKVPYISWKGKAVKYKSRKTKVFLSKSHHGGVKLHKKLPVKLISKKSGPVQWGGVPTNRAKAPKNMLQISGAPNTTGVAFRT